MSLRVDLEQRLASLRNTMQKLSDDIQDLEQMMKHHFTLETRMHGDTMKALEKEFKLPPQVKSPVS